MSSTTFRLVARVGSWLISVVTIGVGIVLLLTRTVVVWESVDGQADMASPVPIDVTVVGLVLLSVGILCLVAVLLVEGWVA